MARIRTIKPAAWQSAQVGRLPIPARLMWVVTITLADDEGRFNALPTIIAGHGYAYDEDAIPTVRPLLNEIAATGLLVLYEVDGVPYGAHPNFRVHQIINRPSPSRLPAPPEGSFTPHGQITEDSEGEGKGREEDRKGKEEDNAQGAVVSSPDVLAVCKLMEDVGLPFSDRGVVEKLISDHPQVDVVAAAEKCAAWAAGRSGVRHPLRALLPFVTAADAPEKKLPDPALAAYANIGAVDDGSGS